MADDIGKNVLTLIAVSDSCYEGKAEDKSGDNLRNLIEGKKV